MSDMTLIVNGRAYGGWKSVRVTRSIESLAGSFALEVSDRWGDARESWPIREEDACRVVYGNTTVIDGFVDKRSQSIASSARTLGYTGRDRAAALVDCSIVVDPKSRTSNRWAYRQIDLAEFARALAAPFGIRVSVQDGLTLPKARLLAANPGDKVFQTIARVAGEAGVMVVSDGAGGILITRTGATRAAALVEGFNIASAQVEYDGADRYHRYVLHAQSPGTDQAAGAATSVLAEARDLGVRRTDRELLIRADKAYDAASARRRVDWEARIRAARAETVTVTVQDWTQPHSDQVWPVNALVLVSAPSIGVQGDMLISQVDYTRNGGGTTTQLRLVRPDAFTPEPKAVVAAGGSGGAWKELAKGAL